MNGMHVRERFVANLDFEVDDFQSMAFDALEKGRSVLVSAPTGSGKTLIAEFAVHLALAEGKRAFYTAPIKALSNQKYRDFCGIYGDSNVGLLTGDNSINPSAPVVVMTTEVLRNMIYAGSEDLDELHSVVLDEVHYIQDAYRGQVWEEIIIHLPQEVILVCLSATVSNSEEIRDWIATVRGGTDLVLSNLRPVPLECRYAAHDRDTDQLMVEPVLINGEGNGHFRRIESQPLKSSRKRPQRRFRLGPPDRPSIITFLHSSQLLPAIFFIFSRAQCDAAANQIANAGFNFNNEDEQFAVQTLVEQATAGISEDDLNVLGIDQFEENLKRGVASHHAGMIPPLKECVEQAFLAGLIKVVFATETLAVGINMPARSVVIEKVTKFKGDHHEVLSPADFTQLTGRAGRRGLDTIGVALICANPYVRFDSVVSLVSNKSFNLRSVFRPSCNMAANLIATHSQRESQHLLNLSLAQYQSDKEIVILERRREKLENQLRSSSNSPGSLSALNSIQKFGLGDIVIVETNDFVGPVAVVAIADRKSETRITCVTLEAERITFSASELSDSARKSGSIQLPVPYVPQRRDFVVEVASRLLANAPRETFTVPRRASNTIRTNSDRRLIREIDQISQRQESVVGAVSRRFTAVTDVLNKRGFASKWNLTDKGHLLRGIFHELDLVICEALWAGLFDDLNSSELASFVSCLVYEPRNIDSPSSDWLPNNKVKQRWGRLNQIHRSILSDFESIGLPDLRLPDSGMAFNIWNWAEGLSLRECVEEDEIVAGDFVRTVRNLIDLLSQISEIAPLSATREVAAESVKRLDRGIVKLATGVQ